MAGVKISSPLDATGNFPAVLQAQLEGSYRSVQDLTERDAIPAERRVEGMKVYVIADGDEYVLLGGLLNGNWQLASVLTPVSFPAPLFAAADTTIADTEYVFYLMDASAGPIVMTLPATPTSDNRVVLKDRGSASVTNSITIDPGVNTIEGLPSIVMTLPYNSLGLIWDGVTWLLITNI